MKSILRGIIAFNTSIAIFLSKMDLPRLFYRFENEVNPLMHELNS